MLTSAEEFDLLEQYKNALHARDKKPGHDRSARQDPRGARRRSICIAGVIILVRGVREPLGWILGLSFIAYGVYRIALVRRALRE